jgi:thioredoxin-like negative regulator of GroEL
MPDSLNLILQKASDLVARSDYAGAADALGLILQKEANNPAALRMLAEAMHHLGEPEHALALLSDSVSAGGMEASTLCRIAEILKELKRDQASTLIRLGRNDEAVALLSHVSAQS